MLVVDPEQLTSLAHALVALTEDARSASPHRPRLAPIADRAAALRMAERLILSAVPLVRDPLDPYDVAVPESVRFLSYDREGHAVSYPPDPIASDGKRDGGEA